MRRFLAVAGTIIFAIAITVTAMIWAGPLMSGALFLSRPTGKPAVSHDLPPSYELRHKGHVDISTGLYIREDEDLVLRHTPPFILTRTYLSGDHVSRQFGMGTTDNAEWYLIGDPARFTWAELILADGGRIHFDRTSRGTSYQNALFVHRATPTGFYGSRLGWTGLQWVLRFQDGSLARFQDCGPSKGSVCSLIQLRDGEGHVLVFQRDRTGRLLQIQAPTERIAFEYDDRDRIVHASDNSGHRVEYSYDVGGRLVRVADADGSVRSYSYSAQDEMLTIREPGWFIENTFDGSGRVTRQVTLIPQSPPDGRKPGMYVMDFAYKALQGLMTETNVKEYDGTHTVYRFDSRYVVLEIDDADGINPVMVSFERDPVGHFTTAVTVRCTVNGRRVTGTARASAGEEQTKQDLLRQTCWSAHDAR